MQTPEKCAYLIQYVAWAYFALDAVEEGEEKRSTSVTFLGPFWLAAAILALSVLILQLFGETESDFLVFFFTNFSFIFLTCQIDFDQESQLNIVSGTNILF